MMLSATGAPTSAAGNGPSESGPSANVVAGSPIDPGVDGALAHRIEGSTVEFLDASVLLLGDSQAFTLSEEFVPLPDHPGLRVANGGILGCGVVRGRPIIAGRAHGDTFEHCDTWEQDWMNAMTAAAPDVTVMFIGAWEILDRIVDGRRYVVGSPEYDAYVEAQLVRAFDIATTGGTPLVLLGSPCYRETTPALGGLDSDRNDPLRRAWFNELATRVAAGYGDLITRVDVGEMLCPGGVYTPEIDGVTPRPDGVHFGPEGARAVWHWLAPRVTATLQRSA